MIGYYGSDFLVVQIYWFYLFFKLQFIREKIIVKFYFNLFLKIFKGFLKKSFNLCFGFFFFWDYNLYNNGKYVLILIILVNFFLDKFLLDVCLFQISFFLELVNFYWLLMLIIFDLFFRMLVIFLLKRISFFDEINSLIFFKYFFIVVK